MNKLYVILETKHNEGERLWRIRLFFKAWEYIDAVRIDFLGGFFPVYLFVQQGRRFPALIFPWLINTAA